MGELSFYVRMRGSVTGPYELPALRTMVRRGALSRIHELSADGTAWAAAGTHSELFAPAAGGAAPVAATLVRTIDRRPPLPSPAEAVRKYFYRQEGRTFGPIPLPILQRLAASGKLNLDAQVWPPDDKTPIPARQLADLHFQPAVEAAHGADVALQSPAHWRGRLALSLLAALPLLVAALIILFLHHHHLHSK